MASRRSSRRQARRLRRLRHGSCLHIAGSLEVKEAATFRERIPRDAIRAQCDLLRRPGPVSRRCCSTDGFEPASIERDGRRSFGERPLSASATSPACGFTRSASARSLLLRPLVSEMARRRPNWQVVISTTTTTGLAVARRTFPDLVTFYAPLDFSWATRRAVRRIRPTVLALVELELWPNLIRAAKREAAQVAIINARLSSRSYRGYRSLRAPLQPTFDRIDVVAAQNGEYARRFVELGIPGHRVSITGSVKYDGLESDRNNEPTRERSGSCWAWLRATWFSWRAARWREKRPRCWRRIVRLAGSIRACG